MKTTFLPGMGHKCIRELHFNEVLHKAIGGIEIIIELQL